MPTSFNHKVAAECLCDLFSCGDDRQKRRYHRLPCRMDMRLKDREMKFTCVDVSPGGMGIEFITKEKVVFIPGDRVEFIFHLFDGLHPLSRQGRFLWCIRLDRYRYRAGIRCE
ncbi:MAG: PilZ domain-containing protein [Candidatus Omnitrophica bacterium]|nr:PilZ domain-containing protein [Candidatus Omnitrophota bacterium]